MNKSAIKNFAMWAREQLIQSAKQKAYEYEIEEVGDSVSDLDVVRGRILDAEEKNQRKKLIEQIKQKGYAHVIEEAAYTWFNRFIALRFMEVNGYLPYRVFSDKNNVFAPEILTDALFVELGRLDENKIADLLNKSKNEELFKYLIIAQCNALNASLPLMFEPIANWTELLFPANLLRSDSVIDRLVTSIPLEDWQEQVQIIGWMYQYYNTEAKDRVFEELKKNNTKITKENIPIATQLFTPDWIVRYMVENSLGRLWIEGHPNDALKATWKYYLEEAEQEPQVQAQLDAIRKEYAALRPEDIKCIDPCMGSGHILVYMFDVLMQIYKARGYNTRDAVASILQNNLYGLDIDDRAGQLAYFAVMMKARKHDHRIFSRGIQPNVYAIQESNNIDGTMVEYFHNGKENLKEAIKSIIDDLRDAKEYGSLLTVKPVDFAALYARFEEIEKDTSLFKNAAIDELKRLVQLAEIMAQKYHTVVTNPPYLSAREGMTGTLSRYLSKHYPTSKNDLFTVFMDVCYNLLNINGFYSMVNQQSWMFLVGFTKLRNRLFSKLTFNNMIHIGTGAFDGIMGEVVSSVAFSTRKNSLKLYKAKYVDFTNKKWLEHLQGFNCIPTYYLLSINDIKKIPNEILCYQLGENAIRQYYKGKRLDNFADPRVGMATGENDLFVRLWHEVNFKRIGFGYANSHSPETYIAKWYPYNKGGECRRWYGNRTYLVDWYRNGKNITSYKQERLKRGEIEKKNSECWNRDYYFMESISWSKVSSGRFAARYFEQGFIFDVAGCSILGLEESIYYVMGALNSELRRLYIEALSPTLNFETNAIKAFPIIQNSSKYECRVEQIVKACISFEKEDWDSFETSWDFKRHPLI